MSISSWGVGDGLANVEGCRWVQTPLGQSLADAIGFKEPPTTVEQSAKGVVEQV